MTVLRSQHRPGVYYDSIVLMQLQAALAELPGVDDAGAVTASPDNLALLRASGLLPEGTDSLAPEDVLVVVRGEDEAAATAALAQVDELLTRRSAAASGEYRPRTLASAVTQLPSARWALVSVPGRFAAGVAREALGLGLNVLIYSDNVPFADEVGLKTEARSRGLLVLGPDCGTAIINGVGFGFANRVRRGRVGLVAASGTGLQAVTARIHELGGGISHAIGTGGRDLQADVGAIAARQGLSLLERDPDTEVIVLVSKEPDPSVAAALLSAARNSGKGVVVHFLGSGGSSREVGPLHFAGSLGEAGAMAAQLAGGGRSVTAAPPAAATDEQPIPGRRFVRGLFAGGSLAYEALSEARTRLASLHSNITIDRVAPLPDPSRSVAHTILDLGGDEFTQGRLHPMMDNSLRVRRIEQEAGDAETGVILLDVVLGEGAHPDPASELAPVIETVRSSRDIRFAVVVIGTDEDPQDLDAQIDRLAEAGARVFRDTVAAVRYASDRVGARELLEIPTEGDEGAGGNRGDDEPVDLRDAAVDHAAIHETPVSLDALQSPIAIINVGLEIFHESLVAQGAEAVHVDWRPPAGGNERLMSILDRMKG